MPWRPSLRCPACESSSSSRARAQVGRDIRSIFNAPDRFEAQRPLGLAVETWSVKAPKLAKWLEASFPEGLAVFSLPPNHGRRMHTTSMLERPNRELQ